MEDLNLAAQSYEKMLQIKLPALPDVDMAILNKEYKANLEKIKSTIYNFISWRSRKSHQTRR